MAEVSLFMDALYALIIGFIIFYLFPVLKNYKNLRDASPWVLIILSYVNDFIGKILGIYYHFTVGIENVPYPCLVDFFYISSYFLLGFAILIIWFRYLKATKYEYFIENSIIMLFIVYLGGHFGYWLFTIGHFKMVFDIVYVVVPLFSTIVGVPLVVLTRGGHMEHFWILVVVSGIFGSFAETLLIYLYNIGASLFIADFFWIMGYLTMIYAVKLFRRDVRV